MNSPSSVPASAKSVMNSSAAKVTVAAEGFNEVLAERALGAFAEPPAREIIKEALACPASEAEP